VSSNVEPPTVHFEPLRPATRRRLVIGIVFGPLLWLIAFVVAAWLFASTFIIELALVITAASFVIAAVVLALLRAGREREARRYVDGG
jgi:predicted membrane chloride channel (bestrophin family)